MYKTRAAFLILILVFSVSLFAVGRREVSADRALGEEDLFISVISKGFQHEFWQTVRRGTMEAAEELGIRVTFEGPATETMVDVQMTMMRNAIIRRSSAILLAALDAEAMVPLVEEAVAQGIPVATFDSGVNSDLPVTVVATDNRAAGVLAADRLARLIGAEGTVGVIVHDSTSLSGVDRRDGFLERMRSAYPRITVLEPVYGGGFHDRSAELAVEMVRRHPDLVGVFSANEGSTVGAALGLQEAGAVDRVALVGFDASAQQIQLLRAELIDGFVVQNPFNMGYLGIRALHDHLGGRAIPRRIDTGAVYVDRTNIDHPEIRVLLGLSPSRS